MIEQKAVYEINPHLMKMELTLLMGEGWRIVPTTLMTVESNRMFCVVERDVTPTLPSRTTDSLTVERI